MQPIFAESVSHRGRLAALVVALTLVASLAALAAAPRQARGHAHHRLRIGPCHAGYVYFIRGYEIVRSYEQPGRAIAYGSSADGKILRK